MTATLNRPQPTLPATAPIPFPRLLRVEWRKATDTRSARWLIGLTAAVTVLVMLIPLLARNNIEQSYTSYLMFTGIALTTLLPVVTILTLTTEWTQRTVLTTFMQEPRRNRVIGAKVAVAGLMALGAIVFAGLVTATALGIAGGTGRDLNADLGFANAAGFIAFVLVNIGMGVAFGALLHNTAAAIVSYFVVPTAVGILGSAVKSVGRWIDTGTTFDWLSEGDFHGHVPNIVVSVLLWLVLPLVLGLVRTARREIN